MEQERREAIPHEVSPAEVDRILHVLTMEYQSLNAHLLVRVSARYQFLGFLTAGAAILAAGIGRSVFSLGSLVLLILALAVLLFGLLAFWLLTRSAAVLGARIAILEKRINDLVPAGPDGLRLLSWETDRDHRPTYRVFFQSLRDSSKVNSEVLPNDGEDAS